MFRIDETKIKTLKRFSAPHYRTTSYHTVRDFYDRNCVIPKRNGDSYIYGGYMATSVNEMGLAEADIFAKGSLEMTADYEKGYDARLFIWNAARNQAPKIPEVELVR